MLQVSSRVDYGLLLLRQLAHCGPDTPPVPLQELAVQLHLPYRYLAQIARQLVRAGILESFEGVNGGYRLAKRPAKVTLGSVVAALEPRPRLVRCLRTDHDCCPRRSQCSMPGWWRQLEARIRQHLNSVTLAQLP